MKPTRFWIEIVALSSAVACALALLLATFGAATSAAEPGSPEQATTPQAPTTQASAPQPSAPQQQTYEGMVTDSHCGARHDAAIGRGSSDCTRACVHAGAHFALVNGDKTYLLTGDTEALKRSAGQRSIIVGTLNDDTISVSSITPKI